MLKAKSFNDLKINNQAVIEFQFKQKTKEHKPKKGNTFEVTLKLFKEGKSIAEIATIRELVVSTIESHLAKFVNDGILDISEVIDMDRIKKLEPYFEVIPESLNELKASIPFETTYSELRIMKNFKVKKAAPID